MTTKEDMLWLSMRDEAGLLRMIDVVSGFRKSLNRQTLPRVLKRKFHSDGFNPAAMKHVSVFPKLKLAFNRIKKNGNSTTVSLLDAMEQGTVRPVRDAKRQTALLRNPTLPMLSSADALFYFSIVRNPYSRTLSAFLNKFDKPEYRDRFGAFALTPEGFHQFLKWLGEDGLEANAHWDLQKKLMLGSLSDFDAILRFEDFPNCLENLLKARELEMPSAAETILASVQRNTRTNASLKLDQYYSEDSIEIVRSLFKDDFEFLGYSNDLADFSAAG